MNKTIYEAEFTKMVHDKMREANRFKEYERITKNRIGGDYWNTYQTIRYMLRTMTDILENGDKLVLLGYFTVKPKSYKERTACPEMERTRKNVYEIPERYKAKFKSGTVLNRACEAYGDYLKEEANNKDDEYEEDPRENLINRLVEYKKYKDMVDTFKTLEDDRRNIYTKEPINLGEFTDYEITNDGSVTVEDLTKALSDFLKRKEDEKPLETKITKKEISVTDRTKDIRNILKEKKKVSFFDLFEVKTREYVVVTFLSILEMAKFGEINIIQENNFNNIVVSLKEGEVNE